MERSSMLGLFLGAALLGIVHCAAIDSSVKNVVELRVIVDMYAFNSWKSKVASSKPEAEKNAFTQTTMENYIKSTFNDVNLVYKGLMSSGINLEIRVADVKFITGNKVITEEPAGSGRTDESKILDELARWLSTKRYSTADHTMLLTGLDISAGTDTSILGMAPVGAMCHPQRSLSVVEAVPDGSVVLTIAHELGHSLDVLHDGEENTCSGNYVMAASGDPGISNRSIFRFSTCSAQAMKSFLTRLHDTDGCLSVAHTTTSTPATTAQPLGKLFSPDQMCKMVTGDPRSYLCRVLYGAGKTSYSELCGTLMCQKASTGSCQYYRSANGFTCGKGKSCHLGDCKADITVPSSATDTCPQGDSPGQLSFFENKSCAEFVTAYSYQCDINKNVFRTCCGSCLRAGKGGTATTTIGTPTTGGTGGTTTTTIGTPTMGGTGGTTTTTIGTPTTSGTGGTATTTGGTPTTGGTGGTEAACVSDQLPDCTYVVENSLCFVFRSACCVSCGNDDYYPYYYNSYYYR